MNQKCALVRGAKRIAPLDLRDGWLPPAVWPQRGGLSSSGWLIGCAFRPATSASLALAHAVRCPVGSPESAGKTAARLSARPQAPGRPTQRPSGSQDKTTAPALRTGCSRSTPTRSHASLSAVRADRRDALEARSVVSTRLRRVSLWSYPPHECTFVHGSIRGTTKIIPGSPPLHRPKHGALRSPSLWTARDSGPVSPRRSRTS